MIFARPIDQIPDFDRAAKAGRHDLGPIVVVVDRGDLTVVGVGLLSQEIQRICEGR